MGRICTGRRPLADMLLDTGRRRSVAFTLELACWRAYERLRAWRNMPRARLAAALPVAGGDRLLPLTI